MIFSGLNALVTGASRGIGREIALQLAKNGANVVINYNHSRKEAEDLCVEIAKIYKVKAIAIQGDMGKEQDVELLVETAYSFFDKIDILVNNAGICTDMEVADRTVGQFKKTFDINLFGVYQLTKLVGEKMKKNRFGKIVNVSSNNSINAFYPTTIDYDASKSAINSLTKNFAIELAPFVNVNAVAPGWIDTDMNKGLLTPDIAELESQRILKNRIGTPKDVANLVTFLLSNEADYITGQIIAVDGGMF